MEGSRISSRDNAKEIRRKMKQYKLLEDLPTFKAGDIFEIRDDGCLWLVDTSEEGHWKKNVMAYHKHTLEAFPNILEDWFEEISGFWYIGEMGNIEYARLSRKGIIGAYKRVGNYFKTIEEAVKALGKLEAWKRLKDKGFRFKNSSLDICCHTINFKVDNQYDMTDETSKDLFLLFGGKDE